ncbi:hypothetical protein [Arenimonas terrae]|uniref:Uncharacterized protein n=1 Tax=Arenimonas terrae TaxID=2546226 RepID=A0A5C4RNJ4_9GAMM|nr:hypothetical protein [Arenimonas terrae]TNJ32813.1 hypothetical protein E1B00_13945 [Arenimonas terrae]
MALAAVLVAVVAAYGASLYAPFQFDDWWAIAGDARVQSLAAWWQALPGIRPLLKLSLALNWTLSPAPWGFRLVNVAAHAANALLLGWLMRHWLPRLAPGQPHAAPLALAIALLFLLHPAATEAVTYVSGRSVSLMATFYLLALFLLTRAAASPAERRWPWLAALAFAAALAVRETAVTLPLAWLLLARCAGQSWRDALPPTRGLLAVLLLAAVAALLTPGYHSFFGWSLQTRGLGPQLLGQIEAHAYLLSHPLPGLALNIDPDVRVPGAFELRHALWLLMAAAAGVIAWQQRRARPWLLFALGWYLLHLAPSNSLLPRFDLANDRHLYLALPGPVMVFALALAALRPPRLGGALLLVAMLALGLKTHDRNHDYRSELALWQATVAASPAKARPWTNLGYARQQAGDSAGAAAAYRCALTLDPDHRQAAWNLAALAPGPVEFRKDDCRLARAGN